MLDLDDIPGDFPVQPLAEGDPAIARATCGTCGLSWDDGIVTSMTPAPSARCPFESFHDEECEAMEIDGPPSGEYLGRCSCGRPIYRSHFAGTIYHSTEE